MIANITDMKNIPSIDPDLHDNYWIQQITLECPTDLLAVQTFRISPHFPEVNLHSGLPLRVDVSAVVWNFLSEDVPSDADGRAHIQLSLYLTPTPELDMLTAAPVEIVDEEQIASNLTTRLVAGSAVTIQGPLRVALPKSACTSRYLALLVTPGAHVVGTDGVTENNVRFLDIAPVLRCSKRYIDLKLIQEDFSISPSPDPSSYSFSLKVMIELEKHPAIGDSETPLFDIQFYVSLDKYLDGDDFRLGFQPGSTLLSKLKMSVATSQTLNLDSGNGNYIMMSPDLPPGLCGSVFLLVVVDDAHTIYERSEGNNVGYAPLETHCTRGGHSTYTYTCVCVCVCMCVCVCVCICVCMYVCM